MAGYGDNSAFTAYAAAAGYVILGTPDAAALNGARQRGSMFVDRYEPRFSGTRVGGFAQDRAWPRTGATIYYGEAVGSVIPAAVVNASYEAAFLELTNPGSLSPVVTGSATVKREKVGQLEVEYSTSSSTSVADLVAMATPVVTTIEGLLWPFLNPILPAILCV